VRVVGGGVGGSVGGSVGWSGWRVWSHTEHIAAYFLRSTSQSTGYRSKNRCGASRGECDAAVARYMKNGTAGSCFSTASTAKSLKA
jgi:hypothetical protein